MTVVFIAVIKYPWKQCQEARTDFGSQFQTFPSKVSQVKGKYHGGKSSWQRLVTLDSKQQRMPLTVGFFLPGYHTGAPGPLDGPSRASPTSTNVL